MAHAAKNWSFTSFDVEGPISFPSNVVYAVWQLEVAPDTGTHHYQGYLQLSRKLRRAQVSEIIPGAHLEIARGTLEENIAYCTKLETRLDGTEPFEHGEQSAATTKGQRSELEQLHEAIKSGLTTREYANGHFSTFVKYPNLLNHYSAAQSEPRDPKTPIRCILLIGPPGCGKSRLVSGGLWGRDVYRHSGGKWFDGYRGQRTVWFDDFGGYCLPFSLFKQVVDRYPFRVEVKGSTCEMAATTFIITTNHKVEDWWKQEVTGEVGLEAVKRRITQVYYFFEENSFLEYSQNTVYPAYHAFETQSSRHVLDYNAHLPQAHTPYKVQKVLYSEEEGPILSPQD